MTIKTSLKFSKIVFIFTLTLTTLCFGIRLSYSSEKITIIDDFEAGLSPHWEEKIFKGETEYTVKKISGNHLLMAESRASASGLIYKIKYNPQEYPILTWRWKIENVLEKGDATQKKGDDYPARIYVVFPHWIPLMTKSINYIWANKLKKGDYIPNSYHSNTVMLAVESGSENSGKWITERRDIYKDFKMIFNAEATEIGAIAIMTDTDNTGESVRAFYDDIRIKME